MRMNRRSGGSWVRPFLISSSPVAKDLVAQLESEEDRRKQVFCQWLIKQCICSLCNVEDNNVEDNYISSGPAGQHSIYPKNCSRLSDWKINEVYILFLWITWSRLSIRKWSACLSNSWKNWRRVVVYLALYGSWGQSIIRVLEALVVAGLGEEAVKCLLNFEPYNIRLAETVVVGRYNPEGGVLAQEFASLIL